MSDNPDYYNIARQIFETRDLALYNRTVATLNGEWARVSSFAKVPLLMAAARLNQTMHARVLAKTLDATELGSAIERTATHPGIEPETVTRLLHAINHEQPQLMSHILGLCTKNNEEMSVEAICNFISQERVDVDFSTVRFMAYEPPPPQQRDSEYWSWEQEISKKLEYNPAITSRIIRAAAEQEIARSTRTSRPSSAASFQPSDGLALEVAGYLRRAGGMITEDNIDPIQSILRILTADNLSNVVFESAHQRNLPLGEALISAALAGIDTAPTDEMRGKIRGLLMSMPTTGPHPTDPPLPPQPGPRQPKGPEPPPRS